jgi:hypothetical protein
LDGGGECGGHEGAKGGGIYNIEGAVGNKERFKFMFQYTLARGWGGLGGFGGITVGEVGEDAVDAEGLHAVHFGAGVYGVDEEFEAMGMDAGDEAGGYLGYGDVEGCGA